MVHPPLIEEVKRNVIAIFMANVNSAYAYHSLEHTESVVWHAAEIAQHYQLKLSDQDIFIITTAAWFHDVGYFNGGQVEHEMRSAQIADSFLHEHNVSDEDLIASVKNCILATHFPQSPKNFLEQIICDADLFHLGTNEFFERDKLMRKEVEITQGKKIDKIEWRKMTIRLLKSHHYFTEYCVSLLNEKKQHNLNKLLKKEINKKNHPHIEVGEIKSLGHNEESHQEKNAGYKKND